MKHTFYALWQGNRNFSKTWKELPKILGPQEVDKEENPI